MEGKRYTEVLIDGKVYTLGGYEDEGYMQRVASYINEMISTLKKKEGFGRQSSEYQNVMVQLNMADDFFKAKEQIAKLEQQRQEMEKEIYSLKHELVTTQMKLEASVRELEFCRGQDKAPQQGQSSHSKIRHKAAEEKEEGNAQ